MYKEGNEEGNLQYKELTNRILTLQNEIKACHKSINEVNREKDKIRSDILTMKKKITGVEEKINNQV